MEIEERAGRGALFCGQGTAQRNRVQEVVAYLPVVSDQHGHARIIAGPQRRVAIDVNGYQVEFQLRLKCQQIRVQVLTQRTAITYIQG